MGETLELLTELSLAADKLAKTGDAKAFGSALHDVFENEIQRQLSSAQYRHDEFTLSPACLPNVADQHIMTGQSSRIDETLPTVTVDALRESIRGRRLLDYLAAIAVALPTDLFGREMVVFPRLNIRNKDGVPVSEIVSTTRKAFAVQGQQEKARA